MLENRFNLCIGLNSDNFFFFEAGSIQNLKFKILCNFSLTQWSIFLIAIKKF